MVILCLARWQDSLFVRKVRNEPDSRRWSVNGNRVSLLRHVSWWRRRGQLGEIVYIIWIDGRRSGYVRVRYSAGEFAELSVALLETARGLGAGSEAIRQATQATAGIPALKGWRATIDERNSSSIRAFSASGFSQVPTCKNNGGQYITFQRGNS